MGTRSRMCHEGWGGRYMSYVLLCIYETVIGRFMLSCCVCGAFIYSIYVSYIYVKCKAVPLKAWAGPEFC